MPDKTRRARKRPLHRPKQPMLPLVNGKTDHPLEEDPAVERGERIETGKTIHRGGKSTGHVPGATEQKP